MSPELLQAGKMTRAADVYSFAMIMVELFTCRRLFEGLAQQQARQRPLLPLQPVVQRWRLRPRRPVGAYAVQCAFRHTAYYRRLSERPQQTAKQEHDVGADNFLVACSLEVLMPDSKC